jgi:hypothetical protein
MLNGLNLNLGGPVAAKTAGPRQGEARPPVEDVIILGSGPGGWAAAIYLEQTK